MTQAELYTIELLQKVESPSLNFKVIKNTNNLTGKVDYRAIPCDDNWQRINALPIQSAPALEQVQDYVKKQQAQDDQDY